MIEYITNKTFKEYEQFLNDLSVNKEIIILDSALHTDKKLYKIDDNKFNVECKDYTYICNKETVLGYLVNKYWEIFIETPNQKPLSITEIRRLEGLCPECGEKGYFINLGLFCKYHGLYG